MRTSLHCILTAAGAAVLLGSLAAPARADIMYVSEELGYFLTPPGGRSYRIAKYTSAAVASIFTTIYGPQGLAFDRAGNLYVASGSFIEKVSPGGVASVFAYIGSH